MDELKLLVDMVAHLPTMAVWVLCGYLAYKVAVVGSIYGLARFAIDRLYQWLTAPKHELKTVELRATIDGVCVANTADALIAQIHRLRGKGLSIGSSYIHPPSVDWLREAIDAKIELDRQSEKAK